MQLNFSEVAHTIGVIAKSALTSHEVYYIAHQLRDIGYKERALGSNMFERHDGRDTVWIDHSDTVDPGSITIRMSWQVDQGRSETTSFPLQKYLGRDHVARPLAEQIGWHRGSILSIVSDIKKIRNHLPFGLH